MFDSANYKKLAKNQLKGRWSAGVLGTIVLLLIESVNIIIQIGQEIWSATSEELLAEIETLNPQTEEEVITLLVVLLFVIGFVSVFLFISFLVFLAKSMADMSFNHLINRYFVTYRSKEDGTSEEVSFRDFTDGLKLTWRGPLAFFVNNFFVSLWTLLFIIPGIIKSIAYSQMFFIIVENPKIGVMKAMKLSMILTDGHKWDLFLMTLSFIGWELLSLLTCGLLQLWLTPYKTMSFCNAYKYLKAVAIKNGRLKLEDFN